MEWTYQERRPAQLTHYVDFLWYFEGPTAHRRKRIFPNGKVELLVNMGDPYRTVVGKGISRAENRTPRRRPAL